MGLTTRQLHSQLSVPECPHYYIVTLINGQTRHCGTLSDVECLQKLHPGLTYEKVFVSPPLTVDVSHTSVKDHELPLQQILPESQQQPLNL
jgi:hypothetical protein